MYETFGEFILTLHSVNKDAAKFLAQQCINKEDNKPCEIRFFDRARHPIKEWERVKSLNALFAFSSDEVRGSNFWRRMREEMLQLQKKQIPEAGGWYRGE